MITYPVVTLFSVKLVFGFIWSLLFDYTDSYGPCCLIIHVLIPCHHLYSLYYTQQVDIVNSFYKYDTGIFRYSDYITHEEVLCKKFLHAARKRPTRTQQLTKYKAFGARCGCVKLHIDLTT